MINNILITDRETMKLMGIGPGSDTVQKMSYIFLSNGDGTFDVPLDRDGTFAMPIWDKEKRRYVVASGTRIPFNEVMEFIRKETEIAY